MGAAQARPESAAAARGDVVALRLYVAGDAPNSVQARANLGAILAGQGADRYTLEVVDFLREPERALGDGVLVTPTLVRVSPPPVRKVIGTLSETRAVLSALGLGAQHAEPARG